MPLYSVSEDRTKLTSVPQTQFQDLSILEEKHFQEMFRTFPDHMEGVFGEPLFVIYNEYNIWNDSKREIDLLALDQNKDLVVIELKRTQDGGHMELQAIRYAAMISRMTFTQIVAAHQKYLGKHGASQDEIDHAETKLREFLGVEFGKVEIRNRPRIILIAPGFSKEIVTTVLWLIEGGINMECYTAEAYGVEPNILMKIERLLPVPVADIVEPGDAGSATSTPGVGDTRSKLPNAVPYLQEKNYLQKGDTVCLIKRLNPSLPVESLAPEEREARFVGNNKFEWQGQTYAISTLCRVICDKHDIDSGAGSFAGPSYWAKVGSTKTLGQKMMEMVAARSDATDSGSE